MKKEEREFLGKFEKSAGISHSFSELRERLEIPESPRRKGVPWRLILGVSLSLALVLAIAIPLSLPGLIDGQLTNGSSSPGEEGVPRLELWDDVETVRLANPKSVQRIYESNLSFIGDGLALSTQGPTGKTRLLSGEAIHVDSSAFREGEEGAYPIEVSSDEGSLTYEVEVIVPEVVSLETRFLKGAYYEGERPESSDFLVEKVREDGSRAAATDSEIGLSWDSLDFSQGSSDIEIFLKTNPSIRTSVSVDLLPLEEIDLAGEYAYIDDYCTFGQPAVEAFSIEEGYFEPLYTEFVCEGEMSLSIEEGKVRMKLPGYNQGGTYDPQTRTFWIDGIAGDPPFACFLRPEGTVEVDLSFVLDEGREETFLALGGYLTAGTLDYIKYLEGDCYLDEEHTLLVNEDTLFTERTRIYCHAEDQDEYDAVLEGIWVDESGSIPTVGWVFEDGGISWGLGTAMHPMSVVREGNSLLVRYGSFEVIRYDIATDRILTYQDEDLLGGTYRRIDRENEAIFTLTYGMNGRDDYVLEKGGSLPSYIIESGGTSISILQIEGYQGEAVWEDVSYSGTVGRRYLSDYWGRYGDYRDFWQIVSPRSLGLPLEGEGWSSYVFCLFEDYELVDYAPVQFDRVDEGVVQADLRFASGKEGVLFFEGGVLRYGGEERAEERYPWEGLLILGRYVSDSGEEIEVDKYAQLGEVSHREDGGETVSSSIAWLRGYDEETGEGTILYSWTSVDGREQELRECPMTREGDVLTILYEGVPYSRSLA